MMRRGDIRRLCCQHVCALEVVRKYWDIIADDLKKAGWSLAWVSAVDSQGRTIWIADVHRDNGNRLVARSDDKLTAFLELERVTRESLSLLKCGTIW
jgi:hypothetical protein